jgi:hypothetical protein
VSSCCEQSKNSSYHHYNYFRTFFQGEIETVDKRVQVGDDAQSHGPPTPMTR